MPTADDAPAILVLGAILSGRALPEVLYTDGVMVPQQVLVVVNSMIRLPNVVFAGGAVGKRKAPRETRSGLFVIEEDMHNLLLESV